MANSKDYIMQESEFTIPDGWEEVPREDRLSSGPVGGGAPVPPIPVDRFASGAISSTTLGLQTDIADSKMGGNVPSFRVQPPQPSANATANAGTSSFTAALAAVAANAQATADEAQSTANQALSATWQGTFSSIVTYQLGAIVEDSSDITYISLANQNLGHTPSSSPTFWRATGQTQFFGAFNIATVYGVGAIVDESGILYISIQAGNVGNTPPNATWWTPLGSASFQGIWASGTSYAQGVTVEGSNGSLYIALQPSLAENPVSTTGYWQLLSGSVAVFGNWNSSSAYPIGAEVFYGNSVWIATTANTNQVPSVGSSYWELVSNLATASGFQMVSNPDFQNGLTNYSVFDNNSTGHVTLSLAANSSAPGGFGQTLEISVAGGGENPGLGGFYYNTALDSGVVVLDHYHVGDTYVVSLWANIPVGYTINFTDSGLGTGGSFTPLSSSYAGTNGWVNYVWQVTVGTSPTASVAFPFFYLTGTFSSAFSWYAAQLSIIDINQPARGNQNVYLGNYSSTTPYVPGNEINYNPSGNGPTYYQCVLASTGNLPTNTTYWELIGTTSVSTGLNGQGSIVPVTVPNAPLTITWDSAIVHSNPLLNITWSAFTIYFPNGSTISVPANTSYTAPSSPSLTSVSGGSQALRTRYIRICFLRQGAIMGVRKLAW